MKNRKSGNFNILNPVIIGIFLLFSAQLNGQNTLIYGKAADYSSRVITFYTISDPILRQKSELATTTIAGDGSFSVLITPVQTIEIYTDLEKYCGSMVIEPGKNYQIALPPYTPRSLAEQHSVYFKPTPYWLGLPGTDNSDLNFAVRSFLTDYNLEIIKNTIQIYQQKSKVIVSGIIDRLDKKYETYQKPYFKTLKKFTFAELEYIINQNNDDFIITKYFATQPIDLINPGYQRTFQIIFTDFLRRLSHNIKNQKIAVLTNQGNFTELVSYFEGKGYKKEFAELVVLKGLYDGYYSGIFSKEGVLNGIEIARTSTRSNEFQIIATQIKKQLTLLAVGQNAPSFTLSDSKGEVVTLDQFRGKFVYLTFFKSSSSDSRREIDALAAMEKRFKQGLIILTISLDDDFENARNLWRSKAYLLKLLDGSKQKHLIKDYNASFPPAFYLIAPDGTFKLSQAPSPLHDFETIYLKIIRDFNFKIPPVKPKKSL